MSDHVIDDLAALVAGDLSQHQTRAAAAHLAECDECRRHLVTSVAGAAALRSAARSAPELFADLWDAPGQEPLPPRPLPAAPAAARRPGRTRRYAVVAAAAAAVVAVSVFAGSRIGSGAGGQNAQVALHAFGTGSGGGDVTMRTRSGTTNMVVSTTGLPAPSAHSFYEVWLFDPHTGKMLAVGVLGPAGKGAYSLSVDLLNRYQAVDISLQRDDGNPAHSNDSVLRARYGA